MQRYHVSLSSTPQSIGIWLMTSRTALVLGKDYSTKGLVPSKGTKQRLPDDPAATDLATKGPARKNQATKKIIEAAEKQAQGPQTVDSRPLKTGSAKKGPGAVAAQWLDIGAPLDSEFPQIRTLEFEGVRLPMITIYDYLAWLFSILGSADTASTAKEAPNFYVPLLALFSRWCAVISSLLKADALPMVHITWWETKILFGATLGEFSSNDEKAELVKARQSMLKDAGYDEPPKGGPPLGKQSFGKCAETNMFLVAEQ